MSSPKKSTYRVHCDREKRRKAGGKGKGRGGGARATSDQISANQISHPDRGQHTRRTLPQTAWACCTFLTPAFTFFALSSSSEMLWSSYTLRCPMALIPAGSPEGCLWSSRPPDSMSDDDPRFSSEISLVYSTGTLGGRITLEAILSEEGQKSGGEGSAREKHATEGGEKLGLAGRV